jgi:DNA-binding response OmpR family regulator
MRDPLAGVAHRIAAVPMGERSAGWKVLVVEGEPRVSEAVAATLRAEGFEVSLAHDGVEAMRVLRGERPDVVVLNESLPWVVGSAPQHHAPEHARTNGLAVIVTGGSGTYAERSRVLKAGADDYVAKASQARELVARIRQLQSRAGSAAVLAAGPIEVDLARGTVSVDGNAIVLTVKEYRLLRRLLEARGRILSREALRESVWGHGHSQDLETRTVDVHIGRLRRKLGAAGGYVITERGLGYRLRR